MLAALPLAWRLGIAVATLLAVLGGVGGLYLKIRHDAYQDGYATASAECEAAKRKMEEANRKAISEAEKKLLAAEQELIQKETQIDDLLMALDHAADEEPGGSEHCLPVGSVRRLQAIQ